MVVLLGGVSGAVAQTADPASRTSDRDFEIVQRGLYSQGEIVGGGLLGTVVGFGTGHLAQRRWRDTGWIFTVGESASIIALVGGVAACSTADDDDDEEDGLRLFSESAGCVVAVGAVTAVTFVAFRVAELIEVWAHPQIHNKRFRKIEEERARQAVQWSPYVAPHEAGGASFGIGLRF